MGKKGFALITVIFILLFLSVILVGFVYLMFGGGRSTVDDYNYTKAFYIAEAGRAYAARHISTIADWSSISFPISKSFNSGSFVLTAQNQTASSITIISTGIFTSEGRTYARAVKNSFLQDQWGFMNDYVLYWGGSGGGTGSTTISNNVTIWGDILTNGSMNFGSGVTVSGDAYASGNITGSTGGITGTKESSAALPSSPPTLNTSYYDGRLAVAATYPSGNQSWNSRTISGTTYVHGNLSISNNQSITVSGTAEVVVTGSFTMSNNSSVGNNLRLICGGSMLLDNNSTVGSNGLFYSGTEISMYNNTETGTFTSGQGTAFITPGNVSAFNNSTIYGFIYCGGTMDFNNNVTFYGNIIANKVDSIGNNSDLYLAPNLINTNNLLGIQGGSQTKVGTWEESL